MAEEERKPSENVEERKDIKMNHVELRKRRECQTNWKIVAWNARGYPSKKDNRHKIKTA